MSDKNQYTFSDSTIAQIVQLFQLGILTGTDVSDQMRTLRVVIDQNKKKVIPCPDYIEMFNENLEKMKQIDNEDD